MQIRNQLITFSALCLSEDMCCVFAMPGAVKGDTWWANSLSISPPLYFDAPARTSLKSHLKANKIASLLDSPPGGAAEVDVLVDGQCSTLLTRTLRGA